MRGCLCLFGPSQQCRSSSPSPSPRTKQRGNARRDAQPAVLHAPDTAPRRRMRSSRRSSVQRSDSSTRQRILGSGSASARERAQPHAEIQPLQNSSTSSESATQHHLEMFSSHSPSLGISGGMQHVSHCLGWSSPRPTDQPLTFDHLRHSSRHIKHQSSRLSTNTELLMAARLADESDHHAQGPTTGEYSVSSNEPVVEAAPGAPRSVASSSGSRGHMRVISRNVSNETSFATFGLHGASLVPSLLYSSPRAWTPRDATPRATLNPVDTTYSPSAVDMASSPFDAASTPHVRRPRSARRDWPSSTSAGAHHASDGGAGSAEDDDDGNGDVHASGSRAARVPSITHALATRNSRGRNPNTRSSSLSSRDEPVDNPRSPSSSSQEGSRVENFLEPTAASRAALPATYAPGPALGPGPRAPVSAPLPPTKLFRGAAVTMARANSAGHSDTEGAFDPSTECYVCWKNEAERGMPLKPLSDHMCARPQKPLVCQLCLERHVIARLDTSARRVRCLCGCQTEWDEATLRQIRGSALTSDRRSRRRRRRRARDDHAAATEAMRLMYGLHSTPSATDTTPPASARERSNGASSRLSPYVRVTRIANPGVPTDPEPNGSSRRLPSAGNSRSLMHDAPSRRMAASGNSRSMINDAPSRRAGASRTFAGEGPSRTLSRLQSPYMETGSDSSDIDFDTLVWMHAFTCRCDSCGEVSEVDGLPYPSCNACGAALRIRSDQRALINRAQRENGGGGEDRTPSPHQRRANGSASSGGGGDRRLSPYRHTTGSAGSGGEGRASSFRSGGDGRASPYRRMTSGNDGRSRSYHRGFGSAGSGNESTSPYLRSNAGLPASAARFPSSHSATGRPTSARNRPDVFDQLRSTTSVNSEEPMLA